MSFFGDLFSVGAAEPIKAVGNIFDSLFTSDEEREQAKLMMKKIEQHPALVQAEINKVQAQHRSLLVAGGRPAIMWVCALGLLYAFVVNPTITWFVACSFIEVSGADASELTCTATPELPLDVMMELTLAMLGLAGLRTVEKIKGVAK